MCLRGSSRSRAIGGGSAAVLPDRRSDVSRDAPTSTCKSIFSPSTMTRLIRLVDAIAQRLGVASLSLRTIAPISRGAFVHFPVPPAATRQRACPPRPRGGYASGSNFPHFPNVASAWIGRFDLCSEFTDFATAGRAFALQCRAREVGFASGSYLDPQHPNEDLIHGGTSR